MNDIEQMDRNDATTRRDLFTLQSIHFPPYFLGQHLVNVPHFIPVQKVEPFDLTRPY